MLHRHRRRLVQAGWLVYRPGRKKHPGQYQTAVPPEHAAFLDDPAGYDPAKPASATPPATNDHPSEEEPVPTESDTGAASVEANTDRRDCETAVSQSQEKGNGPIPHHGDATLPPIHTPSSSSVAATDEGRDAEGGECQAGR